MSGDNIWKNKGGKVGRLVSDYIRFREDDYEDKDNLLQTIIEQAGADLYGPAPSLAYGMRL